MLDRATATNTCVTNQPWLGMTDSSDQVAAFSSRGQRRRRHRRRVLAGSSRTWWRRAPLWSRPGRRSGTPTPTTTRPAISTSSTATCVVATNELCTATRSSCPTTPSSSTWRVVPNTNSPGPVPRPAHLCQAVGLCRPTRPGGYDFVGTNHVSLPPDLALSPVGAYWYYGVGNHDHAGGRLAIC